MGRGSRTSHSAARAGDRTDLTLFDAPVDARPTTRTRTRGGANPKPTTPASASTAEPMPGAPNTPVATAAAPAQVQPTPALAREPTETEIRQALLAKLGVQVELDDPVLQLAVPERPATNGASEDAAANSPQVVRLECRLIGGPYAGKRIMVTPPSPPDRIVQGERYEIGYQDNVLVARYKGPAGS